MQELTQIDTPSVHACDAPRIERWHVVEPVSGKWSWLTAFLCCNQVHEEGEVAEPAPVRQVRKAA